jgi:hypothetical protein
VPGDAATIGLMTPSYLVPLATLATGFLTAMVALLAARIGARTSQHTSYSQARVDAIATFLDAVDAMLVPQPTEAGLKGVASALLRIRLFYDKKPVSIAQSMYTLAHQSVEAAPVHRPDSEIIDRMRAAADDAEPTEEEAEAGFSGRLAPGMLLADVERFRTQADEALAKGTPQPCPRKRAEELCREHQEWEYWEMVLALGDAGERAADRDRARDLCVHQALLTEARKHLVDAVRVWRPSWRTKRPRARATASA